MEAVDDHQRQMWQRMLELVTEFEHGRFDLGALVTGLRGLFVEADPHDPTLRDGFERAWSPIDAEYELGTEAWAPPGMSSDEKLQQSLDAFRAWVTAVLAANVSQDHE